MRKKHPADETFHLTPQDLALVEAARRIESQTPAVLAKNEDWLRTRTWNLRNKDGTPVTTLTQMFGVIYTVEQVEYWVALPCWEAAPDKLKRQAQRFLRRRR